MVFYKIKSRLSIFYAIFILPPKQWKLPKRSEVIVYDATGVEILAPYLAGYSVEIIPIRGEYVNLPCLILASLKLRFWKGKPIQAYADVFIQLVSPKVIVTFIDNNAAFYVISKRFPHIKTVFIQNGFRGELGDIFGCLTKSDDFHVDYMLVHGNAIGRHYQKFISGESLTIGSIKNNKLAKCTGYEKNSILFISQYQDKPEGDAPFWVEHDGRKIYWNQFFEAETHVLKFLVKWCIEKNKVLKICGRSIESQGKEKSFFAQFLNGCSWEFIPKSHVYSSYSLLDSAEIIVTVDSTLGYESMGRGNKTAIFSCRGISLNNEATKFGWPSVFPENGPFWTNEIDELQLRRVMNYLNTLSDKEWQQTRLTYGSEIMDFDVGNTRLTAFLDRIINTQSV
jgi:surface carbohydrate biosynthesis protein